VELLANGTDAVDILDECLPPRGGGLPGFIIVETMARLLPRPVLLRFAGADVRVSLPVKT